MKICNGCKQEFKEVNKNQIYCKPSCGEKYIWGPVKHKKQDILRKNFMKNLKKDKSCVDCGYNEHTIILELHHKKSPKKRIAWGSWSSIVAMKKEILKCVFLCPNCHRLRHREI